MPAARCALCGRLLMLPSPVPAVVTCALCEVAGMHAAMPAASTGDEPQPNDTP